MNQCQSIVHCLLSYPYTLSKHYVSSQVSTPAKHHMPFHQAASRKIHVSVLRKYPCIRQFPEKKNHMTQLSLQQNQKSSLQLTTMGFHDEFSSLHT